MRQNSKGQGGRGPVGFGGMGILSFCQPQKDAPSLAGVEQESGRAPAQITDDQTDSGTPISWTRIRP